MSILYVTTFTTMRIMFEHINFNDAKLMVAYIICHITLPSVWLDTADWLLSRASRLMHEKSASTIWKIFLCKLSGTCVLEKSTFMISYNFFKKSYTITQIILV